MKRKKKIIKMTSIACDSNNEALMKMEDTEEHDPRESLKQSLIEMKLIREGKLPRVTWAEYLEKEKQIDDLIK